MHPPLDRPHAMCQTEIETLKQCHASNSKLKFWACNEIKFAMDKCFKKEKQELMHQINADYDEKRKREDDAFQDAMGYKQSFEEFLKTDPQYLKDMKKVKEEEQKR